MTVSVHRLVPSALRGSGSEGCASANRACSWTAAVSAGDWHPSDASVLETFPMRVDGKTAKWILLMSEQHLISCCKSDAPKFFSASADWMCLGKKKWMRLWSNTLLSLLRMRSDLEDSSLLLSKRPTLCGSVGDAGRTQCCWEMSFVIVFPPPPTFSEILAVLFIFFWHATEEYFQHLSKNNSQCPSESEIYSCTWQLCTVSILPL